MRFGALKVEDDVLVKGYLVLVLTVPVMLFFTGCIDLPGDDDGEDGITLSNHYTGTLTLTYSRTFPTFTETLTMSVNLTKKGEISIGQAPDGSWDADEVKTIEDDQVRQRDHGTASVTPGSSVSIVRGKDVFVALDVHVTLTGEQETFAWDEESKAWISVMKVPYTLEDPITPPLEFDLDDASNAMLGGKEISHTSPQAFGSTVTYGWKLFLIPGLG